MSYDVKDLEALWDLIKGERMINSYNRSSPDGLEEVAFSTDFDEFERDYKECSEREGRHPDHVQATLSIEYALGLLRGKEIQEHHLSCASSEQLGDDAALCIHYRIPGTNRATYSVAILGVCYRYNDPL